MNCDGRTHYFMVLDDETDDLETVDNTAIENEAHDAGPKTARKLMELPEFASN